MPVPLITLLSDFGLQDPYVGIMKGVILGICREARIVDLTHEVIPYQIAQAAFHLEQSWPYFPQGSIHVVVVDPGVGTLRRPILVEAGGHSFIGPDNGVFSMLEPALIREITVADSPASHTFHGRDIFAPTAARLANGAAPQDLGTLVSDPVRLKPLPEGTVLHVDHFGNVITNLRATQFHGGVSVASQLIRRRASTYAEVSPGELFLIEGSSGYVEIALNQGNAAERLGIGVGTVLSIC
jgi:S-adenosyl-L-methionine hydrolase (adenosine-forming)